MLFSTITAFSVSVLTAFNSPLLLPVNEPSAVSSDSLEFTLQDYLKQAESKPEKPNITEQKVQVEKTETVWKCKGCNQTESYTLEYLQKQGIKDKNALATIMVISNKKVILLQIFVRVAQLQDTNLVVVVMD